MHFSYEISVATTNTVTNPSTQELKLPCGIITKVDIVFPYGCDRAVRVQLWDGAVQILPTNQNGFYALDGMPATAAMYYNLDENYNHISIKAWTVTGLYPHTITVMIDIKGPEEPDLLEVMQAQVNIFDRLIDWIRSYI